MVCELLSLVRCYVYIIQSYWILRQSDVNNIVWSAQRGTDMQFAYDSNSNKVDLSLFDFLFGGEGA